MPTNGRRIETVESYEKRQRAMQFGPRSENDGDLGVYVNEFARCFEPLNRVADLISAIGARALARLTQR